MKIVGTRTEKTSVEIDIDPLDLLKNLEKYAWSKFSNRGEYIDKNGYWVFDTCHRTGLETMLRKATPLEEELDKAMLLIREIIKMPS